jgi:uncharacterized protein YecE (DUF72 family)
MSFMDFGKLADISQVDWTLPPDDAASGVWPKSQNQAIYLGPTGWSMPSWVGNTYPAKAKSADFLQYYGKQFSTIEQNGTYYRMPDAEAVAKWVAATPEDFRFCPKVPQIISNSRDLSLSNNAYDEFVTALHGFGPKLGVAFLQLPTHAGEKVLKPLEQFLDRHAGRIPLAIEGRNAELFAAGPIREYYFSLLDAYQIGAVMTDVSGRRDVLHGRITQPDVLIRFVGNGLVASDHDRMDAWIARWAEWFDHGVERIFCFTHEPENLLAPEMALLTQQKIAKLLPQVTCRGPILPYPTNEIAVQASLF